MESLKRAIVCNSNMGTIKSDIFLFDGEKMHPIKNSPNENCGDAIVAACYSANIYSVNLGGDLSSMIEEDIKVAENVMFGKNSIEVSR